MRHVISMLMIIVIGIMLSRFAEAKGLSVEQQQNVVNSSLKYVLEQTMVSPMPQTVLGYFAGPRQWKIYKPVEKMSGNGIKFTMWPIKVLEGQGSVLASQNLGFQVVEQKYLVGVSYTVYGYFNETSELAFEVSDVKLLFSHKVQ